MMIKGKKDKKEMKMQNKIKDKSQNYIINL